MALPQFSLEEDHYERTISHLAVTYHGENVHIRCNSSCVYIVWGIKDITNYLSFCFLSEFLFNKTIELSFSTLINWHSWFTIFTTWLYDLYLHVFESTPHAYRCSFPYSGLRILASTYSFEEKLKTETKYLSFPTRELNF